MIYFVPEHQVLISSGLQFYQVRVRHCGIVARYERRVHELRAKRARFISGKPCLTTKLRHTRTFKFSSKLANNLRYGLFKVCPTRPSISFTNNSLQAMISIPLGYHGWTPHFSSFSPRLQFPPFIISEFSLIPLRISFF